MRLNFVDVYPSGCGIHDGAPLQINVDVDVTFPYKLIYKGNKVKITWGKKLLLPSHGFSHGVGRAIDRAFNSPIVPTM